ncbi:MAG: SDR family oxidoreductase [Ilumatobacteraceae bacterium]|jgi:NAD(P)-dependent dehydrogenase (short-subunit alcohol dehydrogenase family)|nr:MAG: 3-ketoacyl-ACP reductase [Acidimicrobium sp. BACL27 MAG-120823-bin4]MDP4635018.1 SDR family oxidoreductase [Ilumatobacteraceae bacterium]MDP4695596.1 SDR family oxidoreductase [Ilumatobacteraceae bacterium]MDP4735395.1 SDR family oxidoreductase [Ilumatobacteraceae bacterium]MDP5088349.1 SDR family oxidoreductase [Ilumatobacteraceae bacterium]
MEISLRGKTAIVTGASRGIGKAIAKSFVDAGAQVMLTSRKLDALQAAAKEMDGETDVFAANAGEIDQAKACIDATMERFGKIDILVNNAATNPYYGETLGVDSARFDKTFQVNLKGPLFWSQAVWNASMQNKPGVILNIASVGGLRAEQGLGVYNLTKAAVIHLTSQLACELGKTRVVGIAPGLVKTLFASVLIENVGDKLASALPTKRLGEPQDIANLALFLCSDLASWITGETYVIDGGAGVRSGTM